MTEPARHAADTNPLLDAALWYADQGYPVYPIWWPKDGGCTCEKPDCDHPGKHPLSRLVKHGKNNATHDQAVIRRWWARYPDANIGLVTGPAGGLLVLDVDRDAGGFATLAALEAENGPLPETRRVTSGGGGRHYHFPYPEQVEAPIKSRPLGPGLDVKADGGSIIVPPSRHKSGGTYTWEENPLETPLAPVPGWLLALLQASGSPRVAPAAAPPAGDGAGPGAPAVKTAGRIPEHQRHITLASLAGTMRARGMSPEALEAALLAENRSRCEKPLPDDEVQDIARAIGAKPAGPPAASRPAGRGADARPVELGAQQWPAPLEAAAYQGLAGLYVRLVEPHTEADPAALLGQFLVGIGNLLGRRVYFPVERGRHYPNLNLCLVGPTAKGRKGTAWDHVRTVLRSVDTPWASSRLASGLSSGEGLIWAVHDEVTTRSPIKEHGRVVDYQDVISEPAITDKRLLVVETEFAAVLHMMRREGSSLSAIVRQAWDQGDLRALTKNSQARATGAHVSIIGHITLDELRRYLDRTEIGNGFANRFLFLCARRVRELPEGGELESIDFAPLLRSLHEVVRFAQTSSPPELRRDPEAAALWRERYHDLSQGRPGLFGAVVSRAEAQTVRLALLYALLDCSPVIGRRHLEAALAVWRYAEESARFIFGAALGDPLAEELLAFVRARPEGGTRTEIRDLCSRNRSAEEINGALAALTEAGLVTVTEEPTGGRPITRIKSL